MSISDLKSTKPIIKQLLVDLGRQTNTVIYDSAGDRYEVEDLGEAERDGFFTIRSIDRENEFSVYPWTDGGGFSKDDNPIESDGGTISFNGGGVILDYLADIKFPEGVTMFYDEGKGITINSGHIRGGLLNNTKGSYMYVDLPMNDLTAKLGISFENQFPSLILQSGGLTMEAYPDSIYYTEDGKKGGWIMYKDLHNLLAYAKKQGFDPKVDYTKES